MEQNNPFALTPESTALMVAIVDDMCAGGTEVLMTNQKRYNELGIPGIFMRSPQIKPTVIDDAFAARVWANWNRKRRQ